MPPQGALFLLEEELHLRVSPEELDPRRPKTLRKTSTVTAGDNTAGLHGLAP